MVNEIIGYLALHNNNFNGSIPDWIGSLNLLYYLNLERNEFSGELPIEICDLVNIGALDIFNTLVEGTILSLI
jgi:hypothetical protein